jgi:hypothetical protein
MKPSKFGLKYVYMYLFISFLYVSWCYRTPLTGALKQVPEVVKQIPGAVKKLPLLLDQRY